MNNEQSNQSVSNRFEGMEILCKEKPCIVCVNKYTKYMLKVFFETYNPFTDFFNQRTLRRNGQVWKLLYSDLKTMMSGIVLELGY